MPAAQSWLSTTGAKTWRRSFAASLLASTACLRSPLAANASIDAEVCGLNAVVVVFGTEGGEATLPVRPPLFKSLSFRFILLYNFSREELERAADEVERALDDGGAHACTHHSVLA